MYASKLGLSAYWTLSLATCQSGPCVNCLSSVAKNASWSAVRAGMPPYTLSRSVEPSVSRYVRAVNASSGCLVLLRMRNVSALNTAVVLPLYDGAAAMSHVSPAGAFLPASGTRQYFDQRKFTCPATLPEQNV